MAAGIPTIAAIQGTVAARFGLDRSIMVEPDGIGARLRDRAHPRQLAMTLAMLLTDHSEVRVGHFFGGRDHTTVLSARRAVEKRRREDPKLHALMREITFELIGRP